MGQGLSAARDGAVVRVFGGDVERAARQLKKQLGKSGMPTILRERAEGVTRKGRKLLKAQRAVKRNKKKLSAIARDHGN